MADIEELARLAIDCGLKIHRELGPGLLESVYEAVLAREIGNRGVKVDRQVPVAIEYDGLAFAEGFRADLLIDDNLIVEVKSVDRIQPVHGKQLLTYLRLTGRPLGVLLNFGGATFREGIRRIVNNHVDIGSSRLRVNQSSSIEVFDLGE
jgi:GxxExxY protein